MPYSAINYCDDELSDGFLWPRTVENSAYQVPCNLASSYFSSKTLAVRQCGGGGIWGSPDVTTCTLEDDTEPFLLHWLVINTDDNEGFAADGTPDNETRLILETEVTAIL